MPVLKLITRQVQ